MLNLTAVNLTEPILPENPLTYFEEYNNKVLLWMTPLLVFTVMVNIYILFNIILDFVKMYNDCVERIKLYVKEKLNVKKDVKIVRVKYF